MNVLPPGSSLNCRVHLALQGRVVQETVAPKTYIRRLDGKGSAGSRRAWGIFLDYASDVAIPTPSQAAP